jgi:hypothetical protein
LGDPVPSDCFIFSDTYHLLQGEVGRAYSDYGFNNFMDLLAVRQTKKSPKGKLGEKLKLRIGVQEQEIPGQLEHLQFIAEAPALDDRPRIRAKKKRRPENKERRIRELDQRITNAERKRRFAEVLQRRNG